MANKTTIVILALVALAAAAFWLTRDDSGGGQAVVVKVPQLTETQTGGKTAFDKFCVSCHGRNAAGTSKGPPLIHRIYEPNHHGDASFVQAAKYGTRAHHWPFGNMPPVAGIKDRDISSIIAYIRALQKANGIF
jgi:cytochrome c553